MEEQSNQVISRLLWIVADRQAKVEELSGDVAKREAKVEELSWIVFTIIAKVAELSGTVAESQREVEELSRTVANKQEMVEELTGAVAERQRMVEELTGAVADRQAKMEELSGNFIESQRKEKDFSRTVAEHQAKVEELTGTVAESQRKVDELSENLIESQKKVEELSRTVVERQAKAEELSRTNLGMENQMKTLNFQILRAEKILAFTQSCLNSTADAFRDGTLELQMGNVGHHNKPNPPQMVHEKNKTDGHSGQASKRRFSQHKKSPDLLSSDQKQMVPAPFKQNVIDQIRAETCEKANVEENEGEDGDASSKSFRRVAPVKENSEKRDSGKRRIKKHLDEQISLDQPKRKRRKKSMRDLHQDAIEHSLTKNRIEAGKLGKYLENEDTFDKSIQSNSPNKTESFIEDKKALGNNLETINESAGEQVTRGRESSIEPDQAKQLWTGEKCPRMPDDSFCGKELSTKEEQQLTLIGKEQHLTSKPLIDRNEDPLSRGNHLGEFPAKDSNSTNSTAEEEKDIFESTCPSCNMLFRSYNRLATQKSLQVHEECQHGQHGFATQKALQVHEECQHGATVEDKDKDNFETVPPANSGCKSTSQDIELTNPKDCSKPPQMPNNAKEETQIVSENEDSVEHDVPAELVKDGSLSKLMTESDELKKVFGN